MTFSTSRPTSRRRQSRLARSHAWRMGCSTSSWTGTRLFMTFASSRSASLSRVSRVSSLRPPEVEQRQVADQLHRTSGALQKSFKLGQLSTHRSVQHVGPSSRLHTIYWVYHRAPTLTIMDCFDSTARHISGGLILCSGVGLIQLSAGDRRSSIACSACAVRLRSRSASLASCLHIRNVERDHDRW